MVQSKRNQRTLHQSVHPCPRIARLQHNASYRVNSLLDHRPDKKHQNADDRIGQAADNWHKPCAAEERKHLRQFNFIKPIVQSGNAKPYDNASEHAHLKRRNADYGSRRSLKHSLRATVIYNHRPYGRMHNEKSNCSRKRRYFFFFFRHANGDAHGKDNGQVSKYNVARRAHNLQYGV